MVVTVVRSARAQLLQQVLAVVAVLPNEARLVAVRLVRRQPVRPPPEQELGADHGVDVEGPRGVGRVPEVRAQVLRAGHHHQGEEAHQCELHGL